MDSCFALVGARQHSVAKICNASQEPTHINCKVTRSLYQVTHLRSETRVVTSRVSERKKTKVSRLVSRLRSETRDVAARVSERK